MSCLSLFLLSVVLFSSSAAQEMAPHREFSANVLMRMGTEKSGIGARIQLKQDNLYLDYPDLVHHRHIPFWFLSNGLVASVKEATDEDFNPGPGGPLFLGIFLRFRPANPDRFCEEFRPYFIEFMKASAGELSDEDLTRLQNPEQLRLRTDRTRDRRAAGLSNLPIRWIWNGGILDERLLRS